LNQLPRTLGAREIGGPYGAIVELLALTGQRREEVAGLRPEELDLAVIKSLSHPGKNLTGLSFLNTEVSAKRLELLRDLFPKIQRIAVFDDPSSIRVFVEATQTAAVRLGVDLQMLQIPSADGFEPAFQKAVAAQSQAVNVLASAFFNSNRQRLIELAAQYRLPAMYEASDFTHDGGLISYGPNFSELFSRAAIYADKILKGASPSDIPIEQPSTFELVFNLKTAKGPRVDDSRIVLVARRSGDRMRPPESVYLRPSCGG
jgi:putative tryptophan/tyrosine transport system substrate-binding protein